MADEASNESSLFPSSDGGREDSGLQDILSVAAKIKDNADEPPPDDSDMSAEDSGLILFSASSDEGASASDDDDDALFGSFSGGLGAGFGASTEPLSSATNLTPLAAEASVKEATPSAAVAKPAESKRSPLVAVAVVLGLALVGGAAVFLANRDDGSAQQQQAQAEVPAPEDVAVGNAEEPQPEAGTPGASAGAAAEPEPELESETEGVPGESEGLLTGETEGLLADADDPMAMRDGLLENDGSNGVAKAGKWDQGKSYAKPDPVAKPDPDPDPDPDPVIDSKPDPEPIKPAGGGGGGASDEEVDCLLNPDLPKCQTGGSSKPKNEEVLAPKLPDKLSKSQLRTGFNQVKSAAKKCGLQNGVPPGTTVKVHVSIEGATGKVTSVSAKGEHAGTPLGSCVEDAVKNAQFEQFKHPAMGIDYPMIM